MLRWCFIKLFDFVVKEFFAIVQYIEKKIPVTDGKLIISSKTFYAMLDAKLYITRKEKLEIYKTLHFIICNANGLTSVVYDKETKKTSRKIVVNYVAYETLKKLYETELTESEV